MPYFIKIIQKVYSYIMYISKYSFSLLSPAASKNSPIIFSLPFTQLIKKVFIIIFQKKATNQIIFLWPMRQANLGLTQFLILKTHQTTKFAFIKKKQTKMETYSYGNAHNEVQNRKNSHNTCTSSSDNSPNTQENIMFEFSSNSKKSLSTMLSTPTSNQTPQKTIFQSSFSSLSSLQKRSYSQNDIQGENNKQYMSTQNFEVRKLSMQEQPSQNQGQYYQTNLRKSTINSNSNPKQNIHTINESNIKNKQLASQNLNKKITNQQQLKINNNQIQNKSSKHQQHQHKSKQIIQSKQTKVKQPHETRPIPPYKDARSLLFVWMRKLCIQLQMCFDVFALAMKYLDQYHFTHGNRYDRYTFPEHAYGVIIIASKMANKKILTPKTIAYKINMQTQQLQNIQLKLLTMMNFSVFFQTYAKKYQRKLQSWQQQCQKRGLTQQFSLFDQNITSFSKFYNLTRQIQTLAKSNVQVKDQMFLQAFIKILGRDFNTKIEIQTFADITCMIFNDLMTENIEAYNENTIFQKINQLSEMKCEENKIEEIAKIFEKRKIKKTYQNYHVFLNSIFQMSL